MGDDWENDLEEISKETGIDLDQNGENVDDFAHTNKKEKKKKKGKAAAVDSDDDDAMNGKSSPESEEEIIVETKSKSKNKKGKKDKRKDAGGDENDLDEILQALEVNDKKETGGKKG